MKDFRQLKVWEKSHQLALAVYKITKEFPKEELYGLTSQIRRASMSIPTTIAEGCGRNTNKEFARFLQIAMGFASETEYQLIRHATRIFSKMIYTKNFIMMLKKLNACSHLSSKPSALNAES
jgi:four helix bundle protein